MKTLFIAAMVLTFGAAVATLLGGIANMGKKERSEKGSNKLMMLRVGLCALLLAEMVIFSMLFKA